LPRARAIDVIVIEAATIATATAVMDLVAEAATEAMLADEEKRHARSNATSAVRGVILRAIVVRDAIIDAVAIETDRAIARVIVHAIVQEIVDAIDRVIVHANAARTEVVTRVAIVVATKAAIRVEIETIKKGIETAARTRKNVTGKTTSRFKVLNKQFLKKV
jgi:hypothetical protein